MSAVEHKSPITDPSRFRFHLSRLLASPLILSSALFLLALIPRLPDLGRFLTADEFLWIDRSRNFLAGLTNPAYQCDSVVAQWQFVAQGLACTLRTGHPGVTTMWTGSFGFWLRWLWEGRPGSLHDYVVAVATNPVEASFIAPERLGTVLITSLWVVAVYWLTRRLFGASIALLGAALLALDPFHIALSRVIHHDALGTTFMTLSVLCAFIYWGEKDQKLEISRHFLWLLLSGGLAGLAFLSKSPSLFLMPFIALTGLWFTVEGAGSKKYGVRRLKFFPTPYSLLLTTFDGLLWFALAIAVVFICWPAMWVAPLETVQTVIFIGSKYATGGHAKGNFFLGEISQDPGVLFYPVTWLYRTSPLVLVGVAGALIAWIKIARNQKTGQPFFRYLPLILCFIAGFYLLMTLGEKKQDRYFLPVYPWFNLIAAGGIVWILNLFTKRSPQPAPPRLTFYVLRFTHYPLTVALLLIFLLNGFLVATNFPYYFTYFNPILGGIQGAAQAVTIGWGEGLDLAADYLNRHTDPDRTRVASWYQSTFAPFYQGNSISYSQEKGKALAGDYVVFYINQTQRRFPDDIMFDYFESRFKPKKIITLHGLEYAWIYPSLGIDHYLEDQTYSGIASLLAWQWANGDTPLKPGQPADFDLYWEYLGKQPDEAFFLRLVDGQGRPWAEGQSIPVAAENPAPDTWQMGEIIREQGTMLLPPDIPPGQYRLQIGFYTKAAAITSGELLFTLPKTQTVVTVGHSPAAVFSLPALATPIDRPLGQNLTLLGAIAPAQLNPAATATLPLDLYWRVEGSLSADFSLHMGLMDEAGVAQQAWFEVSLAETLQPTETTWQPGDIIRTTWQLDLLPHLPPGKYYFELILPDSIDAGQIESLSFGELVIEQK